MRTTHSLHGLPVSLRMFRVKSDKSAENTKRLLCACSENWTFREVAILGADQKERGLGERERQQRSFYATHSNETIFPAYVTVP